LPADTGCRFLGNFAPGVEPIATRRRHAAESRAVIELRTYTAVPGREADVIARFRDRTLQLFDDLGFVVDRFWVDLDDPGRLVYALEWADRATMEAAWEAFVEDPRWIRIVEETEADGPIVERIDCVFLEPFQR
jgi:hypothetical protein